MSDGLGRCDDWTPHAVYPIIAHIIFLASAAVFVGPELCENEEFIRVSTEYTMAAVQSRGELKKWSPRMRWIGQYFVPQLKTVFECRRRYKELVIPVIRKRMQMKKDGAKMPDDLLQWSLDKSEGTGMSEGLLACIQLETNFAAANNTTLLITSA